jgi:CheY-like chemotaxis protein
VGRLAGGVAHDFNNLLTPILGFAGMLRDGFEADDPRHRDATTVLRAAERARDLTAQLLAFGRKQLLDMRVVDLNVIIAENEPMLRRLLREDIRLDLNLAAGLGSVLADPSQLHTVLINLAVNAADAMPDGGVLRVETRDLSLDESYARSHPGSQAGRHVMLAVSDDGIGMDPETLSLVFEPFFTTKGPDHGTGLGLATVHGIVKQHGGSIWGYSEPRRGTTFKVYLPLVEAEALPQTAEEGPRELRGDERILVVEDDDAVRLLTEAVLVRHGHEVVAVGTPAAAVEMLSAEIEPFALLLTDVVMPGMNGVQLHRTLQGVWPELPAVFMSGYTDNVVAHHGILSEGLHFIQKPFTPDDLMRTVRDVLDRER